MYGTDKLKPQIQITTDTVECPVQGCATHVERQRKSFRCEPKFRCPKHGIYISPSTFQYETEDENLLWSSPEDQTLLEQISTVKRESRMARDNSEDALTWNVFRCLEKENDLDRTLSILTGSDIKNASLVYWSYSVRHGDVLPGLAEARSVFGERTGRGSEPDIIAISDDALIIVEAKLTASNDTTPSNPARCQGYVTGASSWYGHAFSADFETVAIAQKRYELLRFWLLGTWTASKANQRLYLINLVRAGKETDIESSFTANLKNRGHRWYFMRRTWEDIYGALKNRSRSSHNIKTLLSYMKNKTIGYDSVGLLRPAFAVHGSKSILEQTERVIDGWLGVEHIGSSPHHRHKTAWLYAGERKGPEYAPGDLAVELLELIEANWLEAKTTHKSLPSKENWRFERRLGYTKNTRRKEVPLEREIVCLLGDGWANQVPVASGLCGPTRDKHRMIDLVARGGRGEFTFFELKVKSDTPLYAAVEVFLYGMVYLFTRRHYQELGYNPNEKELLAAHTIRLRVLAPHDYYRYKGRNINLEWLQEALNEALSHGVDAASLPSLEMDFAFETFPEGFHGDPEREREKIVAAVKMRSALYAVDSLT